MAGWRFQGQAPGAAREDREAQRRAQLERRAGLAARLAAEVKARQGHPRAAAATVLPAPHQARDVDACLRALANVPLHRLGEWTYGQVSPLYLELSRAALEVVNDGSSMAVMVWPAQRVSTTALVSLLALAAAGCASRTEVVINGERVPCFAPPDGLRAVVFPYSRGTRILPRQVQVDRQWLGELHFDHLKRCTALGGDEALKDYHQVLARVRGLTGRASDGRDYPEFEHPVLDELVPLAPPRGERPPNSELLWRTRGKTDIGRQTRSGLADRADRAAFHVYTLREGQRLGVELRSIARAPDLLLLDVGQAGRRRLGWDWVEAAREMVRCMREIHPATGILAVTDDPWAYQAARFELLGATRPGRRARIVPAPGRVLFARDAGIVRDRGAAEREPEGGLDIAVDGFWGQVDHAIEELRSLANRLAAEGSPDEAGTAREVIATLRRSACLPGSLAEFSAFLEEEAGGAMAADLLAGYRVGADVKALRDARSLASQLDRDGAAAQASAVMRSLEGATPMQSLLADALGPTLRASSRSIVVFRKDMVAEFAAERFSRLIPKAAERLEAGMLRFGGPGLLASVAAAPATVRNQVKRLLLVAPTRPAILAALAEAWLPERLVILADADTLAFAARDAGRLAAELGEGAVRDRLCVFSERAEARVAEIGRHATAFDDGMPPDDVEFPAAGVLDLTGGAERGGGRIVEIEMYNGQRVVARPGTALVVRDAAAATTTFVERTAAQIRAGHEVCVIGPAFVERARTLVNVRATAAEEIREYHAQVARRFAGIPGASVAERLRVLVARMGTPAVSTDTARYWVDLASEEGKSLHEVVPHAPHDRDTFTRFTDALGIGRALAENFWLWAVVAQRSHRMRSGNVFHDAFRGILVDPHAAMAANRDRASDIRALRSMADEHVATVKAVQERVAR